LTFMLLALMARGQEGASALDRVNRLVGPDNVLQVKGKQCVLDGSREGMKVKTDKFSLLDLDPATLVYDADNRIVSISCFSEMGECILRQQLTDGKKNYRWRIAFDVRDSAHANELMVAFGELVSQIQKK
jgi:hypothetical protein